MKIHPVYLPDWIRDLKPLIKRHAVEVYGHDVDPDYDRYKRLVNNGDMVVLAAFDGSKVIGYASILLSTHMHKSSMIAVLDAIFIEKEYRIGRTGLIMIEACELTARNAGAEQMMVTAKPDSAYAKIMSRNYRVNEVCLVRKL